MQHAATCNGRLILWGLGLLFLPFAPVFAQETSRGFLSLPGVEGESTDEFHKDWIDVLSVDHAIAKLVEDFATTGRSRHAPILVRKRIDKSSPRLMQACANGTTLSEAVIDLVKAESGLRFLRIRLTDVLVSSYSVGVAKEDALGLPREEITLVYHKIQVTYFRYSSGSNDPVEEVEMQWDAVNDVEYTGKTATEEETLRLE